VAVVYAETQNGRTTLCELSLGTFNEEFTHTVEEH
jgi:hypothetical protein